MGKNKRKNKSSTIILIIFYTIISLTTAYFSINNFFTIQDRSKSQKELKIKLKEVQKNYDDNVKNRDELVMELEEITNVKDNIIKTKSDVFELASQLEKQIVDGNSKYKIAYITFDDGPYYSTNKVLSTLKEYKIKATFFTIGQDKDTCYDNRSASCAETYKKIVDGGHTIANHTYSHAIFNGLYSNKDSFMNQVKKQEELIKTRTGVITNILRFPGGSATAKALSPNFNQISSALKENNYGWVDWTALDGDGGSLTSYDDGWRNFTNSINENIEVVLFHDYNGITVSMLPKVIEYLQNKDYILLPLFYESIKVNK